MSKAREPEEQDSLTLDQIRSVLSGAVRDLQTGRTTPANANAISNVTGKILTSVKLEMEYAKLTGRKPIIAIMNALPVDDAR